MSNILFILSLLIVLCASEEAFVGHSSTYFFSDASYTCDTPYTASWIPNDEVRNSWGDLTEDLIQWGWSSDVRSNRPTPVTSGHTYSILDGSLTTKFEWNHITLPSTSGCALGDDNCQEITDATATYYAYNQIQGGRKCYGCTSGHSNTCTDNNSYSSDCSTALCARCNGLNNWMTFDLQSVAFVDDVRIYTNNSPAAPRLITVYYSTDSISGPWIQWTHYEAENQDAGWKQFSSQNTVSGIYARYFKILVDSNWGNPDKTELVEFELHGYILKSQSDDSLRWVDSSKINCDKTNSVSSPKWTFGFVASPMNSITLDSSSFVLEIDSTSNVLAFSSTQLELYNLFKSYGYIVSVLKNEYAIKNQSGSLWEIHFYNKYPSFLNIRYRIDDTVIDSQHICFTNCNYLPSDTTVINTIEDLSNVAIYPCANGASHLIINDYLYNYESATLCKSDSQTLNTNSIYSVYSLSPLAGPSGAKQIINLTGNIPENTYIRLYEKDFTHASECLESTALINSALITVATKTATIGPLLEKSNSYENASICVMNNNHSILLKDRFDILNAHITSVVFKNYNSFGIVGYTQSVEITGLGFGDNDKLQMVTGNCASVGEIYTSSDIHTFTDTTATTEITYTKAYEVLHLIYYFQDLCVDIEGTYAIKAVSATSMNFYMNHPTLLTITGSGFTLNDSISFYDVNDIAVEATISLIKQTSTSSEYTITIQSTFNSNAFYLFYTFGSNSLRYKVPNAVFTVTGIREVKVLAGESLVPFEQVLEDIQYSVNFYGTGLSALDHFAYTLSTDCTGELVDVVYDSFDNTNVAVSQVYKGHITFINSGIYSLCYTTIQSATPYYLKSFEVVASGLTGIHTSIGDNMLVQDMNYQMRFDGYGVYSLHPTYSVLTPNIQLTGGECEIDSCPELDKYFSNKYAGSPYPYVTVNDDKYDSFVFNNAGYTWGLNHFIIYDFGACTTLTEFGIFLPHITLDINPREMKLQYLDSCDNDNCAFEIESPWKDIPESIVYNLKRPTDIIGEWANFAFNNLYSSRYYRLVITRNWGDIHKTVVSEVRFIGSACNSLNSQSNSVRLVQNSCEDSSNLFVVGDASHSSYVNTPLDTTTSVCFDFSNPDMEANPVFYPSFNFKIAKLNSVNPTVVPAESVVDFSINADNAAVGDKIMLVSADSTTDASCWTYASQTSTGKTEHMIATLTFDEQPISGSFIVSINDSKTLPISIKDTEENVRIKVEHLDSIDHATVHYETALQPNGKWNTVVDVNVLSPVGNELTMSIIPPSDESCQMCYHVTCENPTFHFDAAHFVLELKYGCTFGHIENGHVIQIIDQDDKVYYFLFLAILYGNADYETDTERALGLLYGSNDVDVDIVEAKSAYSCPSSSTCTAFNNNMEPTVSYQSTHGINSVGIVEENENGLHAFVALSSSAASNAVCYKFGDHPWKLYNNIIIETPSIASIVPSSFITGVESTATLSGNTEFNNGLLRFLKSGVDCNNAPDTYALFSDGTDFTQVTGNTATFTFMNGFGGYSWGVCYKSETQDKYIYISNLSIKVSFVGSLTASDPIMSNTFVVANIDKNFDINGFGFAVGDEYKFVNTGDCSSDAILSGIVSELNINSEQTKVLILINADESETSLSLCYKFIGIDSFMNTNNLLNTVNIHSVSPDAIYYDGNVKEIVYSGRWFDEYTLVDVATWKSAIDSVESEVTIENEVHTSKVLFTKPGSYILTYKFGNETPKEYTFAIKSIKVESITPSILVSGCQANFVLDAYDFVAERNDMIAFVLNGHTCDETDFFLKTVTDLWAPVYSIDDSKVGATISIDSQAVAGDYSLCYKYDQAITSYTDVHINIHAFYGFEEADENNSVVLIGNVGEELTLKGASISTNDYIRFIPLTNTASKCVTDGLHDNECDAPYEDRTFPVTVDLKSSIYFKQALIGTLQVCYKFADLDYWVKYPYTAILSNVESVTASYGSSDVIVANYPKTLTYHGIGIQANDKVFYTTQDNIICNEEQAISTIESLDDKFSATFSFTHGYTDSLVLCYQFNTKGYKLYNSIKLSVYELVSLTAVNSEDSSVAVVGHKKQFKVNGVGISDKTVDMAHWVIGSDCNSNVINMNDPDYTEDVSSLELMDIDRNEINDHFKVSVSSEPIIAALQKTSRGINSMYVSADHYVSFNFASGLLYTDIHEYNLCYKFGDEPFLLYENMNINVWDISSVESYTDYPNDLPDVIVSGIDSPVKFYGNGLSTEDSIFFVQSTDSCRTEYAVSNTLTESIQHLDENNSVYVNFPQSYESLVICYQFRNEGYIKYNQFAMKVFRISSFTDNDDSNIFILNADSTIHFKGFGMSMSNTNDKFRFVTGDSCTNDNESLPMSLVGSTDIIYEAPVTEGKSQVVFLNSGWYSLCYTFGNEKTMIYPAQKIFIRSISALKAFDTEEGDDSIIVKNQFKKFEVYGNVTTSDLIKFVSGTDCSVNGVNIQVNGDYVITDYVEVKYDINYDKYYIDFLVLDIVSEPLLLCYHPVTMLSYIPTNVHLTVYSMNDIKSLTGKPNTLVAKYPKTYVLDSTNNHGIAVGDKVALSMTNCDVKNFVTPISTLDETFTIQFMISSGSDSLLLFCYKFNNEKWVPSLDIRVNEITKITSENCPTCSESKSTAYESDVITFYGYGVSSSSSSDQIKWVYGTSCSADAVPISESYIEDPRHISVEVAEMTSNGVVVVDSTPVREKLFTAETAAYTTYVDADGKTTITFLETSKNAVNNKFSLCYKFGDEPFMLYEDITTSVVGVDTVTSNKGSALVFVSMVPETLIFDGYGLSASDALKFVSGKDCSVEPVAETSISKVTYFSNMTEVIMDNVLFTLPSNGYYSLCYAYGSSTKFDLISKFQVAVFNVESVSDNSAVQQVEKTITYSGYGITMGDFVRYVPVSTDCSNSASALLSKGLTDIPVDEGGHALVSFDNVVSDAYVLCYRFGDEPFKKYPEFTMTVAALNVAGGRRLHDKVFEIGETYTYAFNGHHISSSDKASFVLNKDDCSNSSILSEINHKDNDFSVSFKPILSGSYYLCYLFNQISQSVIVPNVIFNVAGVSSISSTEGSSSIIISNVAKTFIVDGININMNDNIALTKSDCSESSILYRSLLNINNQFTFIVDEPKQTTLSFCYKYFGSSEYVALTNVPSLNVATMSSSKVVSSSNEVSMKLESDSMKTDDMIAFTKGSSCSSDNLVSFSSNQQTSSNGVSGAQQIQSVSLASMNKAFNVNEVSGAKLFNIMLKLKDSYIADSVSETVLKNNGNVDISFEESGKKNLCYQFSDNNLSKMNVVVDTLKVDSIAPNRARINDLVKLVLTVSPVTPSNYYIKFVEEGNSCSSTNTLLFDNKVVLSKVDLLNTYTISQSSVSESNQYSLCLSLDNTEWSLHSSINMSIVDISLNNLNNVLADTPITIEFNTFKNVDSEDSLFFVSGSCSQSNNKLRIQGAFDGYSVRMSNNFMTIVLLDGAENVHACASLSTIGLVSIQENSFTVSQVSVILGVNMPLNVLTNKSKDIFIQGTNVEGGKLWFVKKSALCTSTYAALPIDSTNNALEYNSSSRGVLSFITYYQGTEEYVACYKFNNNMIAKYPKFTINAQNENLSSIESRVHKRRVQDVETGTNAITSLQAEFGSINVFAIGEPKKIYVTGTGIAEQDLVYYVEGNSCDAEHTIFTTSIVSDETGFYYTLNINSIYTGVYLFCYQFADNSVKAYTDYSINTKRFDGITIAESEVAYFIPNSNGVYSLTGFGLASGDKIKFVPRDNSCDSTDVILNDGDNYLDVIDPSNIAINIRSKFVGVQVCYQFGSEHYVLNSKVYDIYALLSVESEEGLESTVAVVDQVKKFTFITTKDVSSSVFFVENDAVDCTANIISGPYDLESGSAEVVFDSASTSGAYQLCYTFKNIGTILYGAHGDNILNVNVKQFNGIEYENDGITAVAKLSKSYTIQSIGSSEQDTLYFTVADCSEDHIGEARYNGDSEIDVEFPSVLDGSFVFCYQFAGAKIEAYDYNITVFDLTSWNGVGTTVLSDIKVDEVSTVHFEGQEISTGDRIKFINEGETDCDSDNTIMTVASVSVDESNNAAFIIQQSGSKYFQLCYQFAGESWQLYGNMGPFGETNYNIYINNLPIFIDSKSGSNNQFILNERKILYVEGSYVSFSDRAKIVLNKDCNSQAIINEKQVASDSGKVSLALQFSQVEQLNMTYYLCYKYATGDFFPVYPVTVIGIIPSEVVVDSGSKSVLVAGSEKVFSFIGSGLKDGDKIKFIKTSCSEEAQEFLIVDNAASILLTQGVSGTLKLCYLFNNEVWTLYNDFVITVDGIDQFEKENYNVNYPVLSDGSVELNIVGYGVSNQNYAYVIPSDTECVKSDIVYPVVNNKITYALNQLVAGQVYDICYVFVNNGISEKSILLSNLRFSPLSVPTLSNSNDEPSFSALVGVSKTVYIAKKSIGNRRLALDDVSILKGAAAGDKIKFVVSGQDCATASMVGFNSLEYISVEEDTEKLFATYTLDYTTPDYWTVCYQFTTYQPYQWYSMTSLFTSKRVDSLIADDGDNNHAVFNVPKTFSISGTHISTDDKVAVVPFGTSCERASYTSVSAEFKVTVTMNVVGVNQYIVCYKMVDEDPFVIPDDIIDIYSITSILVTPGTRNDAAVYSQFTTFEFVGNSNSDADTVAVINSIDNCDSITLDTIVDSKYSMYMNIYAPKISFCYKFNNYPVTKLTINLDVLYIDSIDISIDNHMIPFSYEDAFSIVSVPTSIKFYSMVGTEGDSFKWVSGSAKDCSSASMGFNDIEHVVSVDATGVATYTFVESSATDSWQLCYKFNGKEFVLLGYNQNTFLGSQPYLMQSKSFSSAIAENETQDLEVLIVNVPKTVTFNGDGLVSTDIIYISKNEDCTDPLVTYEYTDGVKTLLFDTLYTDALFFCYSYSYQTSDKNVASIGHIVVPYISRSFHIYGITSATSSVGPFIIKSNDVSITFDGSIISNNDRVYFVNEATLCGSRTEDTVYFTVTDNVANVNFREYPYSVAYLCYLFNNEQPIHQTVTGSEIMVYNIFSVSEFVSVDGYNNNAIVVDSSKTFQLVGDGLDAVSTVFFVTGNSCSSDIVSDYIEVVNSIFTVTISKQEGHTIVYPCLRVDNIDYYYNSAFNLYSIDSMISTDNFGLYVVAGDTKTITINGSGISDADTLEFVDSPNTLNKVDMNTYEVTVDQSIENDSIHMIYTFNNEKSIELTQYALSIVTLNSITVNRPSTGSVYVAFVGYSKTFYYDIYNVYEFSIKFVSGDDCTAEPVGFDTPLSSQSSIVPLTFTSSSNNANWNLCIAYKMEESMEYTHYYPAAYYIRVVNVNSLTPVDTQNFAIAEQPKSFIIDVDSYSPLDYFWFTKTTCLNSLTSAKPLVTLTFDYSFPTGGEYIACYMFENEIPFTIKDFSINVAEITSVVSTLTTTKNNIVLKDQTKQFAISGLFLSEEDTFSLSEDESCRHTTVFPISEMKYVTVSMPLGTYMVCYNYRNYKTVAYPTITINSVEVAVDNAEESNILILNSDKYITLTGYGMTTEDTAYIVSGNSCAENHIQEYHPQNSNTLLINYSGTAKSISLCYSFVNGFTAEETQKYLMSFTVFSITVSGMPEYFVSEQSYILTFPESAEGDYVFFVKNTQSCSQGDILQGFDVTNHEATIIFTSGYTTYVRLCYRYNTQSIFDFGLSNQRQVYGASILNKPSYVFNGEETVLTINALPTTIYDADQVGFVAGDASCDTLTTYQNVNTQNTFVFHIEDGYYFNLCYKFVALNAAYKFPSQNLIIAHIDSISCEGGCDSSISYVPKQITFVSDSIQEGQFVKFVKISCDEEPFGMTSPVTIDSSKQISPVFNAVSTDDIIMCVSFLSNNEYQVVSNTLFTTHVIGVDIESSLALTSSHFVVNKPKTVQFMSSLITLESAIYTLDNTCTEFESSNVFAIDAEGKTTVTLRTPSTMNLCMRFTANGVSQVALISNYLTTVHGFDSITVNEGQANVAIADFVKSYTFTGVGISNNDYVYVSDTVVCERSLHCVSFPVVDGVASILLTRDLSGSEYYVSYKYNNELLYPIDHDVYSSIEADSYFKVAVRGVTYIYGQDNIINHVENTFVANIGYDVTVSLLLTTLEDVTCTSPIEMSSNPIVLTKTEQGCTVVDGHTICSMSGTVTYDYEFNEDKYVFCVKLGDEPYHYYGTPIVSEGSTIYGYVKDLTNVYAVDTTTSNTIAVAEHAKLFAVEAKGWNSLDEMYWIPTTLTCSKTVSSVVSASRTVSQNTFSVSISSVYAGQTLSLCYKFVGGAYKSYPEYILNVASVNSAIFKDGSNVVSYNTPKSIQIYTTEYPTSSGINSFKFVYESCAEDNTVYSTVNYDWSSFTVTKTSTSSSMELFLCYKFNNEAFANYPSITVSLVGVKGIEATIGSSTSIVTETSKTFVLNCVGCSNEDKVLFVNSEVECNNANSETRMDVFLRGSSYAFTYSATRPQTTYYLCYFFANDGGFAATYYDSINVITTSINLPTSETSSTVSIVNKLNTLDFSTSFGVSQGDSIAYVPLFTDCSNIPATYPTFTLNEYKQVELLFTASSNNVNYYLCYTFTSERVTKKYTNIMMTIATIDSVTAVSGSNTISLINVPKTLSFIGSGIQSGDKVMYIRMGAQCENPTDDQILASGTVSIRSATLTFTTAATSYLCYKFGEQSWTSYSDFTMSVQDIHAVNYDNYGPANIAVVGLVKRIGFTVVGDFMNAYAKFVKSSETCDSIPISLRQSSDIVSLNYENEAYYIEFTFSENIGDETASLCIYSADSWFKVSNYEVSIRDITSIKPNVSLPEINVEATLMGYGVSNEDSLIYIPSTSSCSALGTVENVIHPVDSKFTYNLSNNSPKYRVCYQFSEERWTDISEYNDNNYLYIGSITSVSVDGQTTNNFVNGLTYDVTIVGYGLSANDYIRFVPESATDCNTGLKFIDGHDYASVSVIREGSIAASSFTINDVITENTYKLCYNFHNSVYSMNSAITFNMYSINSVSTTQGSSSIVIVNQSKVFTLEGVNVNNNDIVFLSNPNTNCSPIENTDMIVSNSQFTVSLVSALPYDTVSICYRFVGINQVMKVSPITILRIDSIANSFDNGNMFIADTQYTYTISGYNVRSSDEMKFALEGSDCSTSTPLGMDTTITINNLKQAIFTFIHMEDTTSNLVACYKFSGEQWFALPDTFKFSEFVVNSDDKKSFNAIVGVSKTIRFTASNLQETDTYKWVSTTSPVCADDASDAKGFTSEEAIRSVQASGSEFIDTFTLTSGENAQWSLCWKFTTGKYQRISYVTLTPTNIESMTSIQEGSKSMLIKNVPKAYQFNGYGTSYVNKLYVVHQDVCTFDEQNIVGSFDVNDSQVTVTLDE